MERILVGVDRPTREKVPSGTLCGFRARLHQLGEMLTPRGTKSSNPASSSGEMLWGGRRGWQFRRLHQSMECRDAPAERFEQVPRRPGPR